MIQLTDFELILLCISALILALIIDRRIKQYIYGDISQ